MMGGALTAKLLQIWSEVRYSLYHIEVATTIIIMVLYEYWLFDQTQLTHNSGYIKGPLM